MAAVIHVTLDGDKYVVHVNYVGQEFTSKNNYINHSGIYTYTYAVSKNEDGTAHVVLTVDDYGKVLGTLTADLDEDVQHLGLPSTMRYLWIFGRDVNVNSGYTFDTPLQLYKELPYADEKLWVGTLNSYNANGNFTDNLSKRSKLLLLVINQN